MVKNKITIVEIAKIAGVNPSTVSRALHPEKSSHLSEELRQKIKKICEGNNYRPQVAAKGFAARKSYRVGLLLGALRNDLTNPHFSLFIQGICDSLQSAGYTLSILWCEADGKENINEKVQNFLFSDVADAYIMGSTLLKKQSVEMFQSTGRPIVALSNHPTYEIDNFHQVKIDFSGAMKTIWQQMPADALENITLFSTNPDNKNELIKQYAPSGAKLSFLCERVYQHDTENLRASIRNAAAKHWDALKRSKVIWCESDIAALSVYDLCKEYGLEPGRDLLIIGHDNFEATCRNPPKKQIISTIDPHWEQTGRLAGEFTIRCINNKEPAGASISCPASFVTRETFPYKE
ncbi:MAG: LacI family DNA-binding transcriptional regulator [Lentisphaeria bacterium]|nr:LacI family DNA-binding transcriptional regulator [Lentisphaeria bacterium]